MGVGRRHRPCPTPRSALPPVPQGRPIFTQATESLLLLHSPRLTPASPPPPPSSIDTSGPLSPSAFTQGIPTALPRLTLTAPDPDTVYELLSSHFCGGPDPSIMAGAPRHLTPEAEITTCTIAVPAPPTSSLPFPQDHARNWSPSLGPAPLEPHHRHTLLYLPAASHSPTPSLPPPTGAPVAYSPPRGLPNPLSAPSLPTPAAPPVQPTSILHAMLDRTFQRNTLSLFEGIGRLESIYTKPPATLLWTHSPARIRALAAPVPGVMHPNPRVHIHTCF